MSTKSERIKKQLIKDVQALAKKLGRTPYAEEFKHGRSAEYRFGTWNNFLEQAGLEPTVVRKRFANMTDAELLNVIKAEIERVGSTFYDDYRARKSAQAPSRAYIKKRLGLTWNQTLAKIGLDPNVKRLSDAELIEQLKDIGEKLGKAPTIQEARGAGLNISVYEARFGSYNNALTQAGMEVNYEKNKVVHTDDELLQMYKDLCARLGKAATMEDINNHLEYGASVFGVRFGGINNLRELAGYTKYPKKPKYTKASITRSLATVYAKYGRRLKNSEIDQLSAENKDFPSLATICRHFETTKMTEVWEEMEKTDELRLALHNKS